MDKKAKYNIGDMVIHTHHGYRAIIVDIDPLFQASGRHNPQILKHAFSTRNPWYRLLVDESCQITYVEEPFLTLDDCHDQIDNPNMNDYLVSKPDGYHSTRRKH